MLTRIAIVLLSVALLHLQGCSSDPLKDAIFIADGTATLEVVVNVTDAATRKPVSGATVSAIRAGRGTTLLASDSAAMPPPQKTDRGGRAVLHARFRMAASSDGSSVFVAQSFLRIQAPGFRSTDARISTIGRLDFARKIKHPQVTIPVALVPE
jgi:hypothetical protein